MTSLPIWSGVPGDAGHPGASFVELLAGIAGSYRTVMLPSDGPEYGAPLSQDLIDALNLRPARFLPARASEFEPNFSALLPPLDDTDCENGRKLDAWWSPGRLDTGPLHLGAGQLDDTKEHALDLRTLAGFSFVYDACGDGSNGDEAAAIVQCHLAREVDGKLVDRPASRVFHRLVSWLKSLFSRGRS